MCLPELRSHRPAWRPVGPDRRSASTAVDWCEEPDAFAPAPTLDADPVRTIVLAIGLATVQTASARLDATRRPQPWMAGRTVAQNVGLEKARRTTNDGP